MSVSSVGLLFPAVAGREVVARFDGGDVTSDAGMLLVAQSDRRMGLTSAVADAVQDRRQRSKVRHSMLQMVQERVYAIACGYEDANDLDRMREDAALKTVCGHRPTGRGVLAAQPTISRMENGVDRKDLLRMGIALAERVVAQLPRRTRAVVLDIDATDDRCHGQQQFEAFNGYYDEHCYLPLHLYVTGPDGRQRLLGALLRPGNASYRDGLFGMLRLALRVLRSRFPGIRITLRADAGFGYGDVLDFCEKHDLRYVLGLPSNKRLSALSAPIQEECTRRHAVEGDDCRVYGEFEYRAGPWPHARRVVVKVEVTQGKLNPRYVVTNLGRAPARLYDFYCERGDRENRIKELKLDLSSGRTSCHRFIANQMRLILHAAAYALMQTLQAAAAGTCWCNAQAATLRTRLLKVGARVIESCRRIWFHLPSCFPHQQTWQRIYDGLAAST